MSWITGLAIYVVLWWVVLFAVLPWGVTLAEDEHGAQAGAPATPRIGVKILATTAISGAIWLGLWALFTYVLDWRELMGAAP